MFHVRPSKIVLRKQFEDRTWSKGEPFSEYIHDKVILANRVPIYETERLDYFIDGIQDCTMHDHARIQCYDIVEKLLKSFENDIVSTKQQTAEEKTKNVH